MIALIQSHGLLMTDVADAGKQAITYASGRPYVEPGQHLDKLTGINEPPRYSFPRQPFEGLRLVGVKLIHTLMPGVPNGPAKTIAPLAQSGYHRVTDARGSKPMDRAATAYVAVQGVERQAWYEGL